MVSAADTLYVSMICEGGPRFTAKTGAPVSLALRPSTTAATPTPLGMPGTVILRNRRSGKLF